MFFVLAAAALAATSGAFSPIAWKHKPELVKLSPQRAADLPGILDALASALIGKQYELGPLGEGSGTSHPKPLYRLDAFDCTTFLETVLANAYCFQRPSPACLEEKMRNIRYADGKISFATRNHIPELDWLPNNERRGYLADLQARIFPGEWKEAKITIDRALWLQQQGESESRPKSGLTELHFLPVAAFFRKTGLKPEEQKAAEEKLAKASADSLAEPEDEKTRARFRAELEFLKATFVPLEDKLKEIPSGTVLNLIRRPTKNPAEAKRQTLVAHQGLVVQRADGAHIIHAAPSGHVRDQKLGDYLLRYVRSAHFQGISLFRILPPRP